MTATRIRPNGVGANVIAAINIFSTFINIWIHNFHDALKALESKIFAYHCTPDHHLPVDIQFYMNNYSSQECLYTSVHIYVYLLCTHQCLYMQLSIKIKKKACIKTILACWCDVSIYMQVQNIPLWRRSKLPPGQCIQYCTVVRDINYLDIAPWYS